MTITVGDVFRVVAEWDTSLGTVAQLVYHYICTTGGADTPASLLTAIDVSLTTAWNTIEDDMSDNLQGSTISLLKWDFVNHRWDGLEDDPLVDVDGESVAQMISHGVAGLVKIYTEAARRQARKYMFGLTEDAILNGEVVAAVLTRLGQFAALFDNPVTGLAATVAYCTFNTDETSPLYETASVAKQSIEVESVPGYQRRRRPGTGI